MIATTAGERPAPAARWAIISLAAAEMVAVWAGTFVHNAGRESADNLPAAVAMAVASAVTFAQAASPEQWLDIAAVPLAVIPMEA